MTQALAQFDLLETQFKDLDFVVSRPAPNELIAYKDGEKMRAICHLYGHSSFKVYDLISVILPTHDGFDPEEIFKDNMSRTKYFTERGVMIPNSIVTKMVYGDTMLVADTTDLPQKVASALQERDV